MTVDLVVNPAAGPDSRRLARRDRLAFATDVLRAAGATHIRPLETTGAGDAALAIARGVAAGTDAVVVWGGDGTLNEAASVLAGTGVPLGIVPGGSGNGLARALRLSLDPRKSLATAVNGRILALDVGRVGGRMFFNLAGIGFDAAVAARFNECGSRRGLRTYVSASLRELAVNKPATYTISIDDGEPTIIRAQIVVVANGPQYGHGACVAETAQLDDGLFDVVAIPPLTVSRLARDGWRVFARSLGCASGVFTGRGSRVSVQADGDVPMHLDGEVVDTGTAGPRTFTLDPRALHCRVG